MANSGGNDTLGALAGVGAVLALPIVVIVLMFGLAASAGASPNAKGKEVPQAINPNPATESSAFVSQISDFKRYEDVTGYLQKNSQLLSDLQTRLGAISAKLTASTPYTANGVTIPAANVDKIIAIINQMNGDISNIQSLVAANNLTATSKYTTDLISNLQKIQTLSMGGGSTAIVQAAEDIVNQNNNGHGSIKYPDPHNAQVLKGPNNTLLQIDCSGFASYILQKVGIFSPTEWASVLIFATTYAKDPRFSVVQSNIGGSIDEQTIENTAQPGDFLLSNSGSSITTNSNVQNHVVIYLGQVNGTYEVAESTTKKSTGQSGPMFDTLDNRVTKNGAVQMILRPIGATP